MYPEQSTFRNFAVLFIPKRLGRPEASCCQCRALIDFLESLFPPRDGPIAVFFQPDFQRFIRRRFEVLRWRKGVDDVSFQQNDLRNLAVLFVPDGLGGSEVPVVSLSPPRRTDGTDCVLLSTQPDFERFTPTVFPRPDIVSSGLQAEASFRW